MRIKAGDFFAIFTAPPCSTFSRVRNHSGGPPPVRSADHPYGLPQVLPQYKESLRSANLLAARSAEACLLIWNMGGAFAIETPYHHDPRDPSLWLLNEFVDLASLAQSSDIRLDQCCYGGSSTKPTTFRYARVDLKHLEARCSHTYRSYTLQSGERYRSPHPRVPGAWSQDPQGKWVRRSATLAAYPAHVNSELARAFSEIAPHLQISVPSGALTPTTPAQAWQ